MKNKAPGTQPDPQKLGSGFRHRSVHPYENNKRKFMKSKICEKCGCELKEYYHDAGDHFWAGTSPHSEWRVKPCDCEKKRVGRMYTARFNSRVRR